MSCLAHSRDPKDFVYAHITTDHQHARGVLHLAHTPLAVVLFVRVCVRVVGIASWYGFHEIALLVVVVVERLVVWDGLADGTGWWVSSMSG